MADFALFAGRFRIGDVLTAVLELAGPEPAAPEPFSAPPAENPAWGAAWVYGNRLEVVRSAHHPGSDPEFRRLGDIRTDMVMFHTTARERPGVREMLPFLRRDGERQWAFCHAGALRSPERLDTGGRIVDSRNPSERLFLHILSGMDPDDPVASVERTLEGLAGEPELSFLLLSAEMLVASSRYEAEPGGGRPGSGLWFGAGELMRVIATRRLESADVGWDTMANGAVCAISRKRWEL